MMGAGRPAINDVVVSKVAEGHQLLVCAADAQFTLLYRGNGWSAHYATARGAKLATRKGGALWYTTDNSGHLEYLETFRSQAPFVEPRTTASDETWHEHLYGRS